MEQQQSTHSLYLFRARETHHKDVVPSQRLVKIEIAKALIHKSQQARDHFCELALLLMLAFDSR